MVDRIYPWTIPPASSATHGRSVLTATFHSAARWRALMALTHVDAFRSRYIRQIPIWGVRVASNFGNGNPTSCGRFAGRVTVDRLRSRGRFRPDPIFSAVVSETESEGSIMADHRSLQYSCQRLRICSGVRWAFWAQKTSRNASVALIRLSKWVVVMMKGDACAGRSVGRWKVNAHKSGGSAIRVRHHLFSWISAAADVTIPVK